MIVYSPAKINLFLKVLKKRDDGYHDIVTVMQPVSIYDEISLKITNGEGIVVTSDNKTIPLDKTNLVYKAADALLSYTRLKRHVAIKIKKRIPVAAGLGGGSSNAATVLTSLNSMLSTGLLTDNLLEIGAELGSDVPFFIHGGSVIAAGRGEKIEGIEIPKFWYIIINPDFPVSTAWVYGNLHLTNKQGNINILHLKKLLKSCTIEDILENDLEDVTVKRYPQIAEIKSFLTNIGAKGALMSGSGPTVFGVFENKEAAESAFIRIKNDPMFKNMAVFVAQGIE